MRRPTLPHGFKEGWDDTRSRNVPGQFYPYRARSRGLGNADGRTEQTERAGLLDPQDRLIFQRYGPPKCGLR